MKFFRWLWKSNSLLSWVIWLVIIFIVIKFLVFPFLGLIFGTNMPLVVVEGNSMQHEGNFEKWFSLHGSWYEKNNITKQEILDYWPYLNGLNKGDIIVLKGSKEYKKGEIIVFRAEGKKTPIIHRIVSIKNESNKTIYSTKGDRNDGQLLEEIAITKEQIVGKAIARVPALGWIKLFFVEILKIFV
ncbi:MAG: signal peptidase I [Candidatus Pacearchaeota archaeon]